MAQIVKRKSGYLIRVSCGYSADGTKQKTQSMTWHPPKPNMSEKAIEKALNKAAVEFEQKCAGGQIVNTVKLETFIEQWFIVHEAALKPTTIKRYHSYCNLIFQRLGHLRLDKISTSDIDGFMIWLSNQRKYPPRAECTIDLKSVLRKRNETQKAFSEKAGIKEQIVRSCYNGKNILWDNAVKIAEALGKPVNSIFKKIEKSDKFAPKTIRGYHGFLSTVFSYAAKVGKLSRNPAENCTLPKMKECDHNILTLEQAQLFLQLLDEQAPLKYRAFFNVAILGGFRRGEILALQWQDIDFENNIITIRRTINWEKGKGYYYTDPKTKTSRRSVKLSDRAMLILKQLHNEQISAPLKYGDYWNNPEDLVFTSDSGSQMSMGTPLAFLKKFCKNNGLPNITVHSLRHLNATLLINSGANVKTVQSLLGHSEASTTMNIYCHELQSAEAIASNAVASMLENRLSSQEKAN